MSRTIPSILTVLSLLLGLWGKSQPTAISDALQVKIMEDETQYLDVGILLQDRVPVRGLYGQWKKLRPDLDRRNRELIQRLKARARQTQGLLLDRLGRLDHLSHLRPFWITNVIFCRVRADVLREIDLLPGVDMIFEEGKIQQDDLKDVGKFASGLPNGKETGLAVIGAPALWNMGYRGYGTKVLNIDSGIDGDHPALRRQYLGRRKDKHLAWFDPTFRYSQPRSCDWHGTHTLGTILGLDPHTNDTIGVAFEAEWMAANATCPGRSTADVIETFQWAMDPDGDSTTRSDIPDVINNSWTDAGLNDECQSFLYQEVFTALEASGVALVFSAGNTGPASNSIPPPKNINLDQVNTFAVGVINGNSPQLNLISFSARGPSDCGASGSLAIKPEVVAPGFQIRSAHQGGGYRSRSGTSMAAPHVSGALLLLKQAFPDLPGYELKQALYQTALDLGPSGEDNDYGRGLVQVGAAFEYLIFRGNTPAPATSDYDISLKIASHTDPPFCGDTLLPSFVVYNKGQKEVRSLQLRFALDAKLRSLSWAGSLMPGDSLRLNLSPRALDKGRHLLWVEVSLDKSLGEVALLDNRIEKDFFSYSPILPEIFAPTFCREADAALKAEGVGSGEIHWYDSRGNQVGTGSRIWYGKIEAPDEWEVAIFPEVRAGLEIPNVAEGVFSADSSFSIQFDAKQPFKLEEVRVYAKGAEHRTFILKDGEGNTLYSARKWVGDGTQIITLNWDIAPGMDYTFQLSAEHPFFRQATGASYPQEVDGVLRINAAGGGREAYGYFYDWKISYELPCSRKKVALRLKNGNMKADFRVEAQESYYSPTDSLKFWDESDPGKNWAWDFGDGKGSQLQHPTHLFEEPGEYLIYQWVEGKDGCTDAHQERIEVTERLLSTQTPEVEDGWKIYPNPASDIIYLEKENKAGYRGDIEVSLMNPFGKVLARYKLSPMGGRYPLDLGRLSKGLYLLQVESVSGRSFLRCYFMGD